MLTVVFFAATGAAACIHSAEQARRREAAYQAKLASFSKALKSGTTRKDVEGYLRENGYEFRRMCCMNHSGKNAWDDLTQIGKEPHPWYCSEHSVHIGFEFVSDGSHQFPEAHDSDTLKGIQIYHSFDGCL
jgi:hypothetical protein